MNYKKRFDEDQTTKSWSPYLHLVDIFTKILRI